MALVMTAQKQEGIVRTLEQPGRPSVGLEGVTINVLGYPNTIVSKKGGKFSFPIDGKSLGLGFTISRVQKKGYTLVDKKGLRFAYSPYVPIEIVMVPDHQPENNNNNKKSLEDNAFDKAKKNYDQKLATLEKQLKEKSMSEQESRKKYEELNAKYNDFSQILDHVTEHYTLDNHKDLSEINEQITNYLLNAKMELADEQINSKGDFDKREQDILDKQLIKEKAEQLTQQLQQVIDLEREELKKDYYYKYYIHASAQHIDSVAYYLERIVNLDTTEIELMYETAVYLDHYLADYPNALKYYLNTLNYYNKKYGADDSTTGEICQRIGLLYDNYNEPDKALEWHHKALDIMKRTIDPGSPSISLAYTYIGRAYLHKEEYDKALEYTLTGLQLRERAAVVDSGAVAQSYNNLGMLYNEQNDTITALEYYQKALTLREQTYGKDSSLAAFSHMNIGSLYYHHHNYGKALEHLEKAYEVYRKNYGLAYPETMTITSSLGTIHQQQGEYDKALEYYKEYTSGCMKYYGEDSSEAASSLNGLAEIYLLKEDDVHALENYQQVLNIYEKSPNTDEESIVHLRNVIQELKDKLKDKMKKPMWKS